MDALKILKALSNETRLNIMLWLKEPDAHFEPQLHTRLLEERDFSGGICVSSIQKACGVSQSTMSTFLSTLENAGLVESRKIDQYTYYRRCEDTIQTFAAWAEMEL